MALRMVSKLTSFVFPTKPTYSLGSSNPNRGAYWTLRSKIGNANCRAIAVNSLQRSPSTQSCSVLEGRLPPGPRHPHQTTPSPWLVVSGTQVVLTSSCQRVVKSEQFGIWLARRGILEVRMTAPMMILELFWRNEWL